MTRHEDDRLVDYLFDELSEEEAAAFEHGLEADAALHEEASALAEVLGTMRALEAEAPPPWLSAKVMAEARQVAEAAREAGWWPRLRKALYGPVGGLVGAGALALMLVVGGQATLQRAAAPAREVEYEPARPASPPQLAAKPAASGEAQEAPTPGDEAEGRAQDDLGAWGGGAPKQAPAPAPALEDAPARRARGRSAPPASAPPRPAPKPTESKKDAVAKLELDAPEVREEKAKSGPAPAPAPEPAMAEAEAPPAAAPAERSATRAPARAAEAPTADLAAGAAASAAPPAAPAAGASVADGSPEADERQAQAFVQAAWSEKARGEVGSARRVLAQAEQRLAGRVAVGWVYLARARLEQGEGQASEALLYARRAASLRGFRGHSEAVALVEALTPNVRAAPAAAEPR